MDTPSSFPKLMIREGICVFSIFNSLISGYKYRTEQIAKIIFSKEFIGNSNYFFHSSSYSKKHKTTFILLKPPRSAASILVRIVHAALIFLFLQMKVLQCERSSLMPKDGASSLPSIAKPGKLYIKKAGSSYQTPCLHQHFWLDQLLSDSN